MFNRRNLVSSFIATASFTATTSFTATAALAAANVLVISSIQGIVAPALAQGSNQAWSGSGQSDQGGKSGQSQSGQGGKKADNINARIKRQHKKIDAAVKNGQLNEQQANRLHMDVANIENRAKNERLQNGGELNQQQHTTIENLLNQSLNQIETAMGVGTTVPAGANPLGANWQPGPDGAQDPDALKKKLKAQERRALRQEKQANMQAIEQQQLQYEKEVINNLGDQRTKIKQEKEQLENVRNNSGAN
ncbi:MAG: hypothetical protein WC028_05550 [Candidatus Obscuribacterales bacterium]